MQNVCIRPFRCLRGSYSRLFGMGALVSIGSMKLCIAWLCAPHLRGLFRCVYSLNLEERYSWLVSASTVPTPGGCDRHPCAQVAVLTKGTLVDYDMLEAQPDASFLLTVWESSSTVDGNRTSSAPSAKDMDSNVLGSEVTLGLCALDAGTGRFLLGKVRLGVCTRSNAFLPGTLCIGGIFHSCLALRDKQVVPPSPCVALVCSVYLMANSWGLCQDSSSSLTHEGMTLNRRVGTRVN